MNRRFEPRDDKVKNTAAIAPVMPSAPASKPKPDQVIKKVYIQQPKQGEFYGVPRLALLIILANCAVWLCGFTALFIGRVPAVDLVGVVGLLVAALAVTLLVHFAIWKMYWWLLALLFSLASLAVIYGCFAVMTGRLTIEQINLTRIGF